ncbi:butyrate kinase [Macrococcoides caseolyticum]|uniref:butyrate kinase n=1 Tax=Macrococcoides caseolyticum TaxID=69966 RepID=UPI001F3A9B4D|nr:butyrate kinase [Macrococcus caseolyticus]MCE4956585.1 butyrate kinase [Macrococcus caseolyticus]
MNGKYILVINPGSTSSKVALYSSNQCIDESILRYSVDEIAQYDTVMDQIDFREARLRDFLASNQIYPGDLAAVVARGGLMKSIVGGTYLVNEAMVSDLRSGKYGMHASNLGAIIANDIAKVYGVQSYTVDPVVVDEFEEIARISGYKGIERRSVFHALNQKAVARKVLQSEGKDYFASNVIVTHIGGGISIGAHRAGRVIDCVNAIDGEGPYSPERTGGLPLIDFAKKIINEHLNITQVKSILAGEGGMKSYLGEIDIKTIEQNTLNGEVESKKYFDGMCYQISKGIAEMAAVLKGHVDYIILTGGVSHSKYVTDFIKSHVDWIAEVKVMPGEEELQALYEGVMRVLKGEEQAKFY